MHSSTFTVTAFPLIGGKKAKLVISAFDGGVRFEHLVTAKHVDLQRTLDSLRTHCMAASFELSGKLCFFDNTLYTASWRLRLTNKQSDEVFSALIKALDRDPVKSEEKMMKAAKAGFKVKVEPDSDSSSDEEVSGKREAVKNQNKFKDPHAGSDFDSSSDEETSSKRKSTKKVTKSSASVSVCPKGKAHEDSDSESDEEVSSKRKAAVKKVVAKAKAKCAARKSDFKGADTDSDDSDDETANLASPDKWIRCVPDAIPKDAAAVISCAFRWAGANFVEMVDTNPGHIIEAREPGAFYTKMEHLNTFSKDGEMLQPLLIYPAALRVTSTRAKLNKFFRETKRTTGVFLHVNTRGDTYKTYIEKM